MRTAIFLFLFYPVFPHRLVTALYKVHSSKFQEIYCKAKKASVEEEALLDSSYNVRITNYSWSCTCITFK
jgi:hypothetical protein